MEQHPIPQQISSYQFKLVGDMTLAQFGKAAGGIVIAVLINASGLIFFIKYPLMFIFGAGGLAFAFVPFEDRPLETWVLSFIRSIYSPTMFVWKKTRPTNWLDLDNTKAINTNNDDEEVEIPIKDENRIREFLQSLPSFKRESKRGAEETVKTTDMEEMNNLKKVAKEMEESDGKKKKKKSKAVLKKTSDQESGQRVRIKKRDKLTATGIAEFGGIPMPDTPTEPNVLSGMVIGPNDEIIEKAIVEVRNRNDNPVRMFKTNALGQFKTATPLLSGNYLIITEKAGFEFDRVNVAMEGKILEPVKIRAKGKKSKNGLS